MRLYILLFTAALFLSNCTTTYYLVRHAERLDNSKDSPLSSAGQERAEALKERLYPKGVDAVFATPYRRTQQTGQPLANAINKGLTIYGTDTTALFVQALKKEKNKDLLIVGHSNTIPEMVLYFTADTVHIGHDDYDNLFIVKLKRNIFGDKIELEKSVYGLVKK